MRLLLVILTLTLASCGQPGIVRPDLGRLESSGDVICGERDSSRVTRPSFATATLDGATLTVSLGRDSVGFNRLWTAVVSIDNGTAGGYVPTPHLCGCAPTFDLYLVMEHAWGDPRWFAVDVASGGPAIEAEIRCGVEEYPAGVLNLTFDVAELPIHVGDSFLVSIQTINYPYGSEHRIPAWSLTGTVAGVM